LGVNKEGGHCKARLGGVFRGALSNGFCNGHQASSDERATGRLRFSASLTSVQRIRSHTKLHSDALVYSTSQFGNYSSNSLSFELCLLGGSHRATNPSQVLCLRLRILQFSSGVIADCSCLALVLIKIVHSTTSALAQLFLSCKVQKRSIFTSRCAAFKLLYMLAC
jgi:hypothetical protein